MQAAKASLPIRKISHNNHDDTPEQLIIIRTHLTSLNRIFSFIVRVLYPKAVTPNTCFSVFENLWVSTRKKKGLRSLLIDIINEFNSYIIIDIDHDIPSIVSNSTLPKFKRLQQKVAAIRNIVRAQRLLKEASYTRELIAEYEDERCANYAVDKAAFISSSLNRSKRSIVLDRAMSGSQNNVTLETDPIKVEQLANDHFKSVAGVPRL